MALSRKNKKAVLVLVCGVSLAGCGDYLNNWDRVSARAGDALDANTAIQATQPWPSSAYDTDIRKGG